MRFQKRIFFYFLFLFLILPLHQLVAQRSFPDQIQEFQKNRLKINQTAMLVLGSWAMGNILVGTFGNFNSANQAKYFHQGNALWNVVNLGIATFGYFSAVNTDPASMSNVEIIQDYQSLQNFLLLNAGLDLAYMSIGLYLKEKARNSAHHDRLKGYGNSLLLQGAFLLVFDTILFFIHQNHANLSLYPRLETLTGGGTGLGITICF